MNIRKGFLTAVFHVIAGLSTLITTSSYAASNFSIVPMVGTTSPTEVLQGTPIAAYYTVTNLTSSARNGYSVAGLPSTVVQSTTDSFVTNLCGNPINLTAKASCTLKLVISGSAKSNFALCKGTSCTTASQALNVSLNNKSCDPVLGPMMLVNGVEETVYNYLTDGCSSDLETNYSDVPVRPFISANNNSILWFASNSQGYFKTDGVPVGLGAVDILAHMVRATTSTGQCIAWVTSPGAGDGPGNAYPIQTYNNNLWMTVPYTIDGQTIQALIHNEYHPKPPNVANEYGNLVAAQSTDGGNTFNLISAKDPTNPNGNLPIIVAPYPYLGTGDAGMFAQSNIIKWGEYYYILVNQDLTALGSSVPGGVCIYRTNNIADPRSWLGFDGSEYMVPLVPSYPSSLMDPEKYICHSILPDFYRFSWSYNVVLNKFIIIGIDTNYPQANGTKVEAFVYTLANLDPSTGILSSATNTGNQYKEYFLREITWLDQWMTIGTAVGQSYPSVLDPTSQPISNKYGPRLVTGDRNFQYTASSPYIYYTSLFPFNENEGRDRNVVRQALSVQNCVP